MKIKHTFIKKLITLSLVAVSLLFHCSAFADKTEMELLVEMLVDNGVLTKDQAAVLEAKAKEKARKRTPGETSGNVVKTTWNNRLEFESADGNFTGRIGGRIHADAVYVKAQSSLSDLIRPQGDFNRRNDRALLRRTYVYFRGTVYENFFYKLQWDFSEGVSGSEVEGFKDAYIGMRNIPYIGRITLGQMKEPFGLERLTSSNDITFIERALPNVFAPGRSWGAAMRNNFFDRRVTAAAGAFRNSTASGTMVSGNEWNLTTRVTAVPWFDVNDKLAHLGVSYSLRIPESGDRERIRFRQRPELRTDDRFVNTGNFPVNLENRLGLEGAVVYGPLSIQGEFMQTWLDRPERLSKTGYLHGAYLYVSYFLTGESRRYSRSDGTFDSITPKKNFSPKDGTWGAWELAARYSYLDLNDKSVNITGGILNDVTLGINWYLNPNMRLMFNYVHSHRNGVGHADGIQGRAQLSF